MAQAKGGSERESMQALLQQHLRRRAGLEPPLVAGNHLDEDILTAFTEGYLTEAETTPIISHLVDCAFCRRTTARLINLAAELGETSQATSPAPAPETAGRLRRLLDRLAERVLPASDDAAVFAYHARPEETERTEDETTQAAAHDPSPERPGEKES